MQADEKKLKKQAYHHGDLRASLVEATRRLVEEHGPDHVSISAACRLAGVSTAAPYKHFRDKTEMLEAVAIAGMERQDAQMRAAIAPLPEGSIERIVALGQVYIGFATSEPGVFRLMFGLSEEHRPDSELAQKGMSLFGIVKDQVARCLGLDEVTEEAARRAFLLWSFVHGLSFLLIDGKVSKMGDTFDVRDQLSDISWRVMGQRPDRMQVLG